MNPNDEIDIDLLNKISSSNKMEEDVLEWKKKMEEANPSIQSHDTAERSSDLTPQKVANFSEKLYDSVSRLPKYENVSHVNGSFNLVHILILIYTESLHT